MTDKHYSLPQGLFIHKTNACMQRVPMFLVLSVTRRRPPAKWWSGLGITQLVMFMCQKLLIHLSWKMLQILFSLLCVKYILFWFYQSVGFEGNIKYAKKSITSAMECTDEAVFTFSTWQIRSCLLCKFFSPQVRVNNLFLQFCEYFLWVRHLTDRSEFFSCFI